MQTAHHDPLYRAPVNGTARDAPAGIAAEIGRVASLHRRSKTMSSAAFHKTGRNRLTRTVDAALEFVRQYLPPIHWTATRLLAVLLYGYARAVGATAEIV